MNLKYVRKPGRPHTRKSLTINPFKKQPRDKITSILFWEGETMGPGAKIIIGGLNSWEMSTQHMTWAGDEGPKYPPISIRSQVSERQNIIREKTSPLQPTNQLLQPVYIYMYTHTHIYI